MIEVVVHRVWRYSHQLVEEAMRYEDGQLRPGRIRETWPKPSVGDGVEFECECGQEFDIEDEALKHLAEYRE